MHVGAGREVRSWAELQVIKEKVVFALQNT